MIRGTVRFDGLALGEGTFNFLTPTLQLKTKSAFVNTLTGKTHGWTETVGGWSKETLQKLDELRALIERDLAAVHLGDAVEPDSTSASTVSAGRLSEGLGEFLQQRDAPQV